MNFVLVAVVFEGGLAVLAVALGWLFGYDPLFSVHWTWAGAGWGVLATLPPLALLLWSSRTTWGPLERLNRLVRWLIRPYLTHATWIDLAMVSIAAGIGEELLFRGFLQAILAAWFNPWLGLALASIVFGLAHYLSHTYACLAALLGAYLGGLWLACDNLLAPMVTHALYDFLALLYLLRIDGRHSTPEEVTLPEQLKTDPMAEDPAAAAREATLLDEAMRLLVLAHYFIAGITLLTAPAGLYLAIVGWPLAHPSRDQIWPTPPGQELLDPRVLGVLFFSVGVILAALSLMHSALIAYVGRCIARRQRRLFCLIFSAFDLTYVPLGTAISGAALVLLLNKSVKAEFE